MSVNFRKSARPSEILLERQEASGVCCRNTSLESQGRIGKLSEWETVGVGLGWGGGASGVQQALSAINIGFRWFQMVPDGV